MSQEPSRDLADEATDEDQRTEPNALTGRLLSGRYEVEECLGEGAMGAVYRAQHTLMQKTLAIKVLRPQIGDRDELIERFRREAQAAAHIDHPHVCSATDFGQMDDGAFFLVMEYLEGQTLEELLDAKGALPVERAIHIARQICSALSRAHQLDVVHRDLKPENIMLVERDGESDFVKILDFGVARVRLSEEHDQKQLTQAGTVWGTPRYMSPEQASGGEVDRRADLYSLGVILYEMLAGSPPFEDDNPARVMAMHITEKPEPPGEKASATDIPGGLDRLVMQLLEKDREERPASAEKLDEELARFSQGASTDAGPTLDSVRERIETPLVRGVQHTISGVMPRVRQAIAWFGDQPVSVQGAVGGLAAAVLFSLLAAPALVFFLVFSSPTDEAARADIESELAEERATFVEDSELAAVPDHLEGGRTTAALESLEEVDSSLEESAHTHYLRGRVNAQRGRWQAAVEAYSRALEADSRYANDVQLIDDVFERFSDRSDARAAAAAELIAEHLDVTYALDKLVDRALYTRRESVRDRSRDLLEESGQMRHLHAWQQAAIELRAASDCDQKREGVERLVDIGDPAAVDFLEHMHDQSAGCGFLGMQDCHECVREELAEAIEALEED